MKKIIITRPAWIQETYLISAEFSGVCLPEVGEEIDPTVVKMYLEDHQTVQLETEISCHMDANDAHLDAMESDYDRVYLDEFITEGDV